MADSGTYDEATLARQKIAAALASGYLKPEENIKSWTQGLANMAKAGLGGYMGFQADQTAKEEKTKERAELYSALGLPAPASPTAVAEDSPSIFSRIGSLFSGGGPGAPASPAAAPAGPVAAPPVVPTAAPPPAAPRPMPIYNQAQANPMDPVVPPAPDRVPVEPMGDVVRTNPDGTIAGNITAPTIPAATKVAQVLAQPPAAAPAAGPTDVSAATRATTTTSPTLLAGVTPEKKAQIAAMLVSKNPQVKAIGSALMTQAMAESDTPKYDFKTAGDQLFRTNAKTGIAEPIKDVGRSVQPMTDEQRRQWKVPEGVAAGIDDNGKPVFSQPSAVNTVSPVVTGINERFDKQLTAAQAAHQSIASIHETRKALDAGAITGAGAEPRLMLAKIGTLFGLPSEAVANTETARAAVGEQVLQSAKTLGANPSNTDRDYIEKVKGGSIALDEKSMRNLLDMQERWARDGVKRSNAMAEKLVATDPEKLGRFAPMLKVDDPPSYEDYVKANPGKAAATTTAAPDAGRAALEAEMKRRGLIK